jgi:hypothetical protein
MIALPGYIDQDAWMALLEVRTKLKAPNTAYAQKLLLYEVQRIKDAGHDPVAAINQSVLKGWKDVYPPKDKPIEAAANSAHEKTQAYIAEHSRTRDPQAGEHLKAIKEKLRRVA